MNFGYRRLYIGGNSCNSATGRKQNVICPATEQTIAEIAWATPVDTQKALESAAEGFKYWGGLSLKNRTDWMNRLRDAIAAKENLLRECVMYEMGKPWDATAEDFQTVMDALQWYPEEMKRMRDEMIPDEENTHSHRITSQAAGVAVAILAWNFPLLNLGFKIGPALAAGCSIIIKPSEYSPLSAYVFGEICAEINFPAGVINVICGPVEETGVLLCESKIPQVITMIGSSATGRKLIAQSATSVKRMSMELGGNAPVLIFEDADIEKAAADVAALKFGNCGQICVSPNRIFVHKDVYPQFRDLLIEKAKKVKIGFGKEHQPTMGPLISDKARTRVLEIIDEAVSKGAQVLVGGKVPESLHSGYFLEPTVLNGVSTDMRAYKEEVFGPVASLLTFEDEADVLKKANDTEAGLVAYIYSKNMDRIQRLSEQLEFGEVQINGFKYAIYLPHGGIKESGIGKDCSQYALDDYLIRKRVSIQL
jgi:succinate-semialdehyde dehydrogenase/glutarate-semialdehyde dehydrogenase